MRSDRRHCDPIGLPPTPAETLGELDVHRLYAGAKLVVVPVLL